MKKAKCMEYTCKFIHAKGIRDLFVCSKGGGEGFLICVCMREGGEARHTPNIQQTIPSTPAVLNDHSLIHEVNLARIAPNIPGPVSLQC